MVHHVENHHTASPLSFATLPTCYTIGTLTICPNMVLAPMAGVTDTMFRRLIRRMGGCGLVCSEMTNAASMSPKALKNHKLLDYVPEERPFAMQITGNNPELMAQAARKVVALGADVLDINCGCPSPKVTKGGHGASLLRDLPRLSEVLHAVRAAVAIPISLKYRAGWDDTSLNYVETAQRAEAAGIDALALHPRTREQRYTGSACWEYIAEVKQAVSIPVVGNGDIKTAAGALQALATSGVDGIMIGRAALANPWIFQQIAQLRRGEEMFVPTVQDTHALLLLFIQLCQEILPERIALNKLKQFVGAFVVGVPGSATLRTSVHRSRSIVEAQRWIERFYAPFQSHANQPLAVAEQGDDMWWTCGYDG